MPENLDPPRGTGPIGATAPVESAELLALLLEGIRDYAIYVLDPLGRVASWNAGAERMKLWKRDEILGHHFSRFYTPEDVARGAPHAHLDEARVNGRSEAEGWRVRADGSRFWASAILTALRDESGLLRGFAKVTRDVTERRRLSFLGDASAILGASLDYQRTISQVASLAVPFLGDWCAVDILEGGRPVRLAVAHVDPAKVKLAEELNRRYPVRAEETTGVMEVIRSGQPQLIPEVTDEMLAAGAVDEEHLRVARELAIRSAVVVPLAARGRVFGALTLVLSESSRRYDPSDLELAMELARRCAIAIDNARAHEELKLERDRLRSVLDQLPAGVVIADATSGRVVLSNPEGERLLGRRLDRTLHPPGRMRESGERYGIGELPLARALRTGESIAGEEVSLPATDGEPAAILSVNASALRDASGKIVGAVAVFQDVSERVRQAEFRERFLAIVGHDLRTPLHAISGTAQTLLRQGIEPRAATRIANSADRMQHIIDELLDFARSRLGGGVPVQRRPADLRAICREVIDELEVTHPGVAIRFVAPTGDLTGEWDPQRLAQVVSNLVGNALTYGCPEAPVTVNLSPVDGSVILRVHNGGKPIPPEMLPRVFDPFRQGSPASGRHDGLGLGLFIAKQIVIAHGGDIEVTSSAEEGTTFTVRLPRHPNSS